MSLRSLHRQAVRLNALDLDIYFAENELMRTEISAKFRRESIITELAVAGLAVSRWWEDARADFAVLVAIPSEGSRLHGQGLTRARGNS
jgi:L-histidine N-alpha-methyltransferase